VHKCALSLFIDTLSTDSIPILVLVFTDPRKEMRGNWVCFL